MKYIFYAALLGLGLILTSSWWMEVGPFVVEIKTGEPVDTSFVVRLAHHKGIGVQGTVADYSTTKVIYANTPTEFPSGRGISVHTPMNIYVNHPLYMPSKYSTLSLLSPSAMGKNLGLFERIFYTFNRPEKYEIKVEMERLETYLDSYWLAVIKEYRYSKEKADEGKTHDFYNRLNRLGDYRRLVMSAYPNIDFEQIENDYQEIINSQISNRDAKIKLLKILKEKVHGKEIKHTK